MISRAKLDRVGEKYKTREGDEVEIIEYHSTIEITLIFRDGTITKNNQFSPIKRGTVKNPNTPSVCGVGYMGQGIYSSKNNGKVSKIYETWVNVLKRACGKDYKEKFPTYKDVTVVEEWHNFQTFAKWYEDNWKDYMDNTWHLDKDILIKGNKIYSPETCCFVPHKINTVIQINRTQRGDLPIGVGRKGNKFIAQFTKNGCHTSLGLFDTPEEAFQAYKEAKEVYVKELAEIFKGKIDLRIYNIMQKYVVNITD
jgi:predicted RNase H-like HicB family nuclease